ncbi:low temperature requirement protein A [Rugosimonospora acidiphila]|uniref:Low temperature requirement protein A n=1 Tax=Rugosimonospora acidiphila TaxID=556531 RepID=A0ABP9SJE7_9ACTN
MTEFDEGGAGAGRPVLLRGAGSDRVTHMELFFDVVYVLAVTELSGVLVDEPTPLGALRTLLLLIALWWTWVDTAWVTNWFNPDHLAVRLMLIGLMLCSLVISATLTRSFGGLGLWFAGAYVALNLGRHAFALVASRGWPERRRNFERILVWRLCAGAFWLAGGVVDGWPRLTLWLAGLAIDTAAAAYGFYLPKLGRSQPGDWPLNGEHFAERSYLFVILALGESILSSGARLATHEIGPASLLALLLAFVNSVALWWIYFDRGASAASRVIARSGDPGRLGRSAYTYLQLPVIAGIIIASVGNELVLAQVAGPMTIAVLVGGPALFLAGHLLFTRVVFGRLSVARLVAIAALLAVAPVGLLGRPVLVAAAATPVLVGFVAWESIAVRHGQPA